MHLKLSNKINYFLLQVCSRLLFLPSVPDYFCGHSYSDRVIRDVFCDYSPCADYCTVPNIAAIHYCAFSSEPGIFAYLYSKRTGLLLLKGFVDFF